MSNEDSNLPKEVRIMIKRQVELFPISIKFDYRQLSNTTNNSCELEKYFDADLLQVMRDITCSGIELWKTEILVVSICA